MPATRSGSRAPVRVVPGAVSPLTSDLVDGPPRQGVVVGAYRFGVYVDVAGSVLPVLSADAVALPTAVRLGLRSDGLDGAARAGDTVTVGEGAVVFPGWEVRAARWWRPSRVVVRTGADPSPRLGSAPLEAVPGGPRWLSGGVRTAVAATDPARAVSGLVGRGPGLTPSGDDALAGALLVLHAVADRRAPRLAGAVRHRLAATTAASAALLAAAADGWAAPEAVALVDAVVAGDDGAVRRTLGPVLAIGHTSGRDLVTGVVAAVSAVPSGRIAA